MDTYNGPKLMRWEWVYLLCQANGWKAGAEIGVAQGFFSLYLAARGIRMLAVDDWGQSCHPLVSDKYDKYPHADNYNKFMEDSRDLPISVIRGASTEVAPSIAPGSLDFVFIDASHEYISVIADIDAWKTKTKWMLGHDFCERQVRDAVRHRFFNSYFLGPDNCWGVHIT